MRRAHIVRTTGLVLLLCGAGGCVPGWVPPVTDLQIPPNLAYVLDHAQDFISRPDDPLETVDPGTVINALATLDGCWGTLLTEADVDVGLALVSAYRFDAAAGTFKSWTTMGRRAGGIWPLLPIITIETGTFGVTGANTLVIRTERILSNVDSATGHVLSAATDEYVEPEPVERPALVTLDGERLLLFLDAAAASDVNPADERPIYYRFECESGS